MFLHVIDTLKKLPTFSIALNPTGIKNHVTLIMVMELCENFKNLVKIQNLVFTKCITIKKSLKYPDSKINFVKK